jgi:cell division septal protein FtsQ
MKGKPPGRHKKMMILTASLCVVVTAVVAAKPFQLLGRFKWFPIKEVTFHGGSHVTWPLIEEKCGGIKGTDILAISLSYLHDCIKKMGWVKNVSLSRKLPSRLLITVQEDSAVAISWWNNSWFYFAREGRALGPVKNNEMLNLPLIPQYDALNLTQQETALRIAASVGAWASPTYRHGVTSDITWEAKRGWVIHLARGSSVLLGENVPDENLERFQWLLQKNEGQLLNNSVVDLRMDRKIIVNRP